MCCVCDLTRSDCSQCINLCVTHVPIFLLCNSFLAHFFLSAGTQRHTQSIGVDGGRCVEYIPGSTCHAILEQHYTVRCYCVSRGTIHCCMIVKNKKKKKTFLPDCCFVFTFRRTIARKSLLFFSSSSSWWWCLNVWWWCANTWKPGGALLVQHL